MGKRRRGRVTVVVTWQVGESTQPDDVYTATRASAQMFPGGMGRVWLVDGRDVGGEPVLDVLYQNAAKITRRPSEGERP